MGKQQKITLCWTETSQYEMTMTLAQACKLLDETGYDGPMPATLTEAVALINDDVHPDLANTLAEFQDDTFEGCTREVGQAELTTFG